MVLTAIILTMKTRFFAKNFYYHQASIMPTKMNSICIFQQEKKHISYFENKVYLRRRRLKKPWKILRSFDLSRAFHLIQPRKYPAAAKT